LAGRPVAMSATVSASMTLSVLDREGGQLLDRAALLGLTACPGPVAQGAISRAACAVAHASRVMARRCRARLTAPRPPCWLGRCCSLEPSLPPQGHTMRTGAAGPNTGQGGTKQVIGSSAGWQHPRRSPRQQGQDIRAGYAAAQSVWGAHPIAMTAHILDGWHPGCARWD
jgi:hypothetical protein